MKLATKAVCGHFAATYKAAFLNLVVCLAVI